jgi:hypothetical protein
MEPATLEQLISLSPLQWLGIVTLAALAVAGAALKLGLAALEHSRKRK